MKTVTILFLALMLTFVVAASAETDAVPLSQDYLEYIGTVLTERNITPCEAEPEPGNTHAETVDWILSTLRNAGYRDAQISYDILNYNDQYTQLAYPVQNIVLTVEGTDPSAQILVGAHYDGDGVGDNGSGIALLLSTAVSLAGQQPPCTVKYIFFDAEEIDMVGSELYAESMTAEEIASTLYMINIDSIAFGDYCNIYGGVQDSETETVTATEAYDLAVKKASALGISVKNTADLDGYFAANGEGPAIEPNTLYTNPWTFKNPAPMNGGIASPTTGLWSDHASFTLLGIPYVDFEATNWYAAGDGSELAYTGYFETADTSLGYSGMFMNTDLDTWDILNSTFPGRSLEHFRIYCPLLRSLIMDPSGME